ncbi:MAG: nucleotidyltransferase domain-containing protein [Ignavibacterium sp.]
MRLNKKEIEILRESLKSLDPEAKLYLFGSRLYDDKKGGDIDLLIVSKKMTKKDLRKVKRAFYNEFGEQKIDIILDNGEYDDPFVKRIKTEAVEL